MAANSRTPRPVLRARVLDAFACTGPHCPDNCCNTWRVVVDAPTLALYEARAPELLADVTLADDGVPMLVFDGQTGCCPQLHAGGCTIHSTYGTDFLTDTCHLYPRITRLLGEKTVVTASLSCPEIARLALADDNAYALVDATADRVPDAMKDYLPADAETADALALVAHMQAVTDAPETHLVRAMTEAFVLSQAPVAQWPALHARLAPSLADAVPSPITHPHDPLFMLIVMATLVTACKVTPSARLREVVALIEASLQCHLLWDQATVNTGPETVARCAVLEDRARTHYHATLRPLLVRVLRAQFGGALYPYAGLGTTPSERMVWIGYEYALIRLALICVAEQAGGDVQEAFAVQVVQTLTRVLDHVGTLAQAWPMLVEAGWTQPERLHGLLAWGVPASETV